MYYVSVKHALIKSVTGTTQSFTCIFECTQETNNRSFINATAALNTCKKLYNMYLDSV